MYRDGRSVGKENNITLAHDRGVERRKQDADER